MDKCEFCGEWVDLANEGVTYKNGKCAHEECHDVNEFEKENAVDLMRD